MTKTAIFDWKVDTPIDQAVMEALGAASVCWSNPRGAGEFNAGMATDIGNELIALLQKKAWAE